MRLVQAIKEKDKDDVREDAIGVLRQDRDNALANGVMGTISAFDGAYAASELYLRRAVASPNASAAAFNNYAEVLRRLGRYVEAEANARKAVAASPDFWRVHETLADVLLSRGAPLRDVKLSLEKAERLLGAGPEWKTVPPEAATLALIRLNLLCRDKSKALEAEILRRKIKRLPLTDLQRRRLESLKPGGGRKNDMEPASAPAAS